MTSSHPSLAILGAGPVGLEAALAAVDHGLAFALYEAGPQVGHHVRQWGHVRLFTPWELNASPRARRHLSDAGIHLPDGDRRPTGKELVTELLEPLAALPAVAPSVRTGVRVMRVGREGLLKSDEIGTGARAGRPFRLLLRDGDGREWVERADAVLDCTGTWGQPNALGVGGVPAPGEAAARERMMRGIPTPEELEGWAGRRILLVGAGHSAQTAARGLGELVRSRPGTRVVWALRNPEPSFRLDDDPLPARETLHREAERLAGAPSAEVADGFEAVRGATVESLEPGEGGALRVTLRLQGGSGGETSPGSRVEVVDEILSLTGSVGDGALYRQLQVHECYATLGPMGLSAALLGAEGGSDCMTQPTLGVDALRTPEPQFFILGSKAYGRNSTFLLRVGWEQVDQVMPALAQELEVLGDEGAGAPDAAALAGAVS